MSVIQTPDIQDIKTDSEKIDEVTNEELVDPRVQVELERLNTATDLINKLEIELDVARSNFRLLLSESSLRANHLAKKLGSCVEKARPYYEARMHAKQLQTRTQKAALRYERASSAHCAAKEMVYLAEEGLKKEGGCFDPAWQEMLNHATLRVNEAESERVLSQREHQKISLAYNESEKIVQQLHQELKKTIVKSRPYFEMKAQFNQLLEDQRKKVHHLEENLLKMKMSYADALHNLEEISDEIHQLRRSQETLKNASSNCALEKFKNDCHDMKMCNSHSSEFPKKASCSGVAAKDKANGFQDTNPETSIKDDQLYLCKVNSRRTEESRRTETDVLVSDQKFLIPDFNVLRVQESDSESLASNDTADTLDDSQIECLLLEKGLSLNEQEAFSDNETSDK